jgi:hypothetical protein
VQRARCLECHSIRLVTLRSGFQRLCCDCGVPMVTVTTVFHHGTADAKKVVSYQCQKCGGTLGASRLPDGRNRVSRSPLAGWSPRI